MTPPTVGHREHLHFVRRVRAGNDENRLGVRTVSIQALMCVYRKVEGRAPNSC